ncbi:MAG TPA: low specificity L-threonine aldolase [Candidatus Cloacimonas sp.]|jgi:threonine aldolase|nr:low specificity L-threonine aldolase [Candidatus Cloacimonas sp.]
MNSVSFGSDNHSGIHPQVLEAIQKANYGYCPAYGDDPLTIKVLEQIKQLFGGNCDAWFVITGTGANILSLQSVIHSYNAIICPKSAHINTDECGAVQKFTQSRLQSIETTDGKLTPELIAPLLLGNRDQHHSQAKVISISQSTEYGTLYSLQELKALADFAHQNNMFLHIDGARLANAASALNCSLKEMTKDISADVVSFGGTKNGLLCGEAIISFNPEITSDMRFYRKQASQLLSKMRFVSAQFEAYLQDDLYLQNAFCANKMAKLLAKRLQEIKEVTVTQEVEVNSLFVILPEHIIETLQQKYHFYTWNEATNEVRLMCSFNTKEEHIDEFINDLKTLL